MSHLNSRFSKFLLEISKNKSCTNTLWRGFLTAAEDYKKPPCVVSLDDVATTLPEVCALRPGELLTHADMHRFSLRHPDLFWGAVARHRIQWDKEFSTVSDCDMSSGRFSYFGDGELNASVNCVDRHALASPHRPALIWELDEPGQHQIVTFLELQALVCRMANVFKQHGVAKGDRVVIYMPPSAHSVAAMLACARIGAVHSVVFAGFSAQALAQRINDGDAKVVIVSDEGVRGGKIVPLKKTLDEALESCPNVRTVLVHERTGAAASLLQPGGREHLLEPQLADALPHCEPESLPAEHPLFMLYTSGSTGKPKGIVHSTGGYLTYVALSHQLVFNCYQQHGDIFGCVADIGWITGHSYGVYGPLCNGVPTLLFESTPVYPDPGRYWATVERHGLTHFYCAPTATRLLIKHGDEWVHKHDLSSLKVIVGEPINHEAWEWLNEVVGKRNCMLVDTWWQSETGGVAIAPCPADKGAPIIEAAAMRPFYGIDAHILPVHQPAHVDSGGAAAHHVDGSAESDGVLVVTQPWPAIARTIYGDHERFVETYFGQVPGAYATGDGAHHTSCGHLVITGRLDDVINVAGHRIGTAELEDVLDEHSQISETAVVGRAHPIKGQSICAFVVLADGVPAQQHADILAQAGQLVARHIGKFAVPDTLVIVPGLPKTRSGKIMRRLLKVIVNSEPGDKINLGDTSTLADPDVVRHIKQAYFDQ